MNTLNPLMPMSANNRPWYKESYLWLVLGGPLVVVVASVITFVVAVKNPDAVLQRQPAAADNMVEQGKLTPEEKAALELSQMPAQQARNHVKTPQLPNN